ncbi:17894_t:CDS:1, partial [Cetraspora pellucida]
AYSSLFSSRFTGRNNFLNRSSPETTKEVKKVKHCYLTSVWIKKKIAVSEQRNV